MADPSLACAEWQEDLAGWLVAQLDPEAEVALVEHLAGCRACQAEAESLLAVAAVSLGADPGGEPWHARRDASPPPDLADRIVARVAAERRGRCRDPAHRHGADRAGDGGGELVRAHADGHAGEALAALGRRGRRLPGARLARHGLADRRH